MRDCVETRVEEKGVEFGKVLKRNLFLFLLDLEVKRARRYQNFLSILILRLARSSNGSEGENLDACYNLVAGLLTNEIRETDIVGSLGEDKLVVLLPYADVSAGDSVRSRFENLLKYFDLKNNGYEASVRQVCFPMNGTNTTDLVRKALDEGTA